LFIIVSDWHLTKPLESEIADNVKSMQLSLERSARDFQFSPFHTEKASPPFFPLYVETG